MSTERTAYPSTAAWSNAGNAAEATTSCAQSRPCASEIATRTAGGVCTPASTRSSCSDTDRIRPPSPVCAQRRPASGASWTATLARAPLPAGPRHQGRPSVARWIPIPTGRPSAPRPPRPAGVPTWWRVADSARRPSDRTRARRFRPTSAGCAWPGTPCAPTCHCRPSRWIPWCSRGCSRPGRSCCCRWRRPTPRWTGAAGPRVRSGADRSASTSPWVIGWAPEPSPLPISCWSRPWRWIGSAIGSVVAAGTTTAAWRCFPARPAATGDGAPRACRRSPRACRPSPRLAGRLPRLPAVSPRLLAVVYDDELVDALPHGPLDHRVTDVVTPSGGIRPLG